MGDGSFIQKGPSHFSPSITPSYNWGFQDISSLFMSKPNPAPALWDDDVF